MLNFNRVKYSGLAVKLNQAPSDGLPEVVLAGRSNAGKSSLVNALANHSGLAKVSSTPGKTRAVVYFNVDEKIYLSDLPGYGYARISREAQAKFAQLADAYFQAERPILTVLLLVDIRHKPSEQDRHMYEFLQNSGFPFALILAKADKLSRSQALQRRREILRDLNAPADTPAFILSSLRKIGLDEIKTYIATEYTRCKQANEESSY